MQQRLSPKPSTYRRNLLLGLLALNVLVALWIANALWNSRKAYEASAARVTQNMAVALDQSIMGSVDGINLALLACIDFMEGQLAEHNHLNMANVNGYIARAQKRLPDVYGIRATDAQGTVMYGTDVDPNAHASWADRDFFIPIKSDPGAGLVVTDPIYGKVTKKWVLSFVRRYNHPDGSFGGVVSASIPVDYFNALLGSLSLETTGVALLRDSHLGLIARYPPIDAPSGRLGAKGYSPELGAAVQSGERSVTYHAKTTSDGVERTNTYRRLSKVPFHLIAGLGANDYLAPWYVEVRNDLAQLVVFFLVTAFAASRLYRAYLRAQAAQDRSASVLRGASDGIHVIDLQGELVFANDAFFTMLGREPESEARLHLQDWDADITRDQVEPFLRNVVQSGKQILLRSKHRRVDGSVFPVEVSLLPQQLDGRHVLFCSARNIADRLQAEAKAHQAQELMIAAVNAAGEAFVMYDQDDRLAYWNDKYLELYASTRDLIAVGVKFEDLVRTGAHRGIYNDARGRIEDFVAERVAAHQSGNTEITTHLDDGRVFRVLDRKMPNGYIVGFRLDITELSQAIQNAEEAAQSKTQFLANMSHEIRTPMNAILGLLNLLQTTEMTPPQRDYVSKTEGAAQSLLGLLNDILDFSKVEAGKLTLESEPFQIDKLLRSLSVVLSANVGSKNIDILFDIDPGLPQVVRGDAMRLQQVLINLSGNAVKFTSAGYVLIGLRKRSESAKTVTIEFSVQDTGIGIAPEHHARIFSGFAQAEGSTTRKYGGSGLGLGISQRFVGLMGGNIQITSELGEGSTFAFALELPTVASAPDDIAEPAREALPAQRVLVVDDNPKAGELTLNMVRSWGWEADLAHSGAQAMHMIAHLHAATPGQFPYPVIFMDWQMPDMDGWETTRRIRQLAHDARASQPTVIMVTGFGRDRLAHRSEAEQEMLNGFLVKPVTASMLYDAMMDARAGTANLRQMTKGRSSARQLSGMRILLVEDNLINQQVADELLSAAGAIVSLAANGQLGVDAVAAAAPQFDVVLMDVQMPVLDGYGATRAIRQDLGLTQLPIIAMTANAMAGDRTVCMAAGMNEHIGKPFDMAKLVELLLLITGFVAHVAHEAHIGAGNATTSTALTDSGAPALPSVPALPTIAGLELHTALGRMADMRSLYVRTARDFVKAMDTVVLELTQSLAAGDQKLAVMRLHTLKGNAGTLGATELAAHAASLEKLCKGDDGVVRCSAALDQFGPIVQSAQALLRAAIEQLEPEATHTSSQTTAQTAASQQAVHDALSQLIALADGLDMEALMHFSQVRDILASVPGDWVDRLDESLQNLDLQTASVLGREMLAQLAS